MYYLRTRPKATTQQFTIDPRKSKSIDKTISALLNWKIGKTLLLIRDWIPVIWFSWEIESYATQSDFGYSNLNCSYKFLVVGDLKEFDRTATP